MTNFGEIRIHVLKNWNEGLIRQRAEGEFSDDYSNSLWCVIQGECTDNGKHCSFICSLNDWLDNISDLLYDNRFDELTEDDYDVLFRYYTRILLLVSEVIEDFVMLNKQILNFTGKKDASRDLEKETLTENELKNLSEFINSVCKHKTENNNLHVHNHHLSIEFTDFGSIEHDNQICINHQNWISINKDTTILMPPLNYFIELIIKTNNKVLDYIKNRPEYKTKLLKLYADEWTIDVEE
jgi:hypothetical protein